MLALWETDKTDQHGVEPIPNVCDCILPNLNKSLIVKTKGKLKKYKCGVCLSWNMDQKNHLVIFKRERNV